MFNKKKGGLKLPPVIEETEVLGAQEECLKCTEAKEIITKLISMLPTQSGKTIERAKNFIL